MKRTVYIETSIVSYLTARPSQDLIVAGHQALTLEWWTQHRPRFQLYISQIVLLEAAQGDAAAASRRLVELNDIEQLELHDGARELASAFLTRRIIPEQSPTTPCTSRSPPLTALTSCLHGIAGTSPTRSRSGALKRSACDSDTQCRFFARRNS